MVVMVPVAGVAQEPVQETTAVATVLVGLAPTLEVSALGTVLVLLLFVVVDGSLVSRGTWEHNYSITFATSSLTLHIIIFSKVLTFEIRIRWSLAFGNSKFENLNKDDKFFLYGFDEKTYFKKPVVLRS